MNPICTPVNSRFSMIKLLIYYECGTNAGGIGCCQRGQAQHLCYSWSRGNGTHRHNFIEELHRQVNISMLPITQVANLY
jgi:hypothetical protein